MSINPIVLIKEFFLTYYKWLLCKIVSIPLAFPFLPNTYIIWLLYEPIFIDRQSAPLEKGLTPSDTQLPIISKMVHI